MKVVIKHDDCIGCGSCQAMNEKLFKLNDEMKSEYVGGGEVSIQEVLEVAKVCPVLAIEVYDDEGKKVYPE